jgi:hypothetical protein
VLLRWAKKLRSHQSSTASVEPTAAADSLAPPSKEQTYARYADALTIVLRRGEVKMGGPVEEAIVGTLELGRDVDLDGSIEPVSKWLGEREAMFTLTTTRTRSEAGASGAEAVVLLTIIAATSGKLTKIFLREAWDYVKGRLAPDAPFRDRTQYLLQLDYNDLGRELRRQVAHTLDRRESELETVQLRREPQEVSGVFEVPDAGRYVLRVTETLYLINRVPNPA